jgi:hypothetical protein
MNSESPQPRNTKFLKQPALNSHYNLSATGAGGGGGIYYTHAVHKLNSEFTEDEHVVLYGWLSYQMPTSTTLFQGVKHTRCCTLSTPYRVSNQHNFSRRHDCALYDFRTSAKNLNSDVG